MATNSGDLAQALVEGGLTPLAARLIANAIGNAASPTFSQGQDRLDSTPAEQLRLITPDVRRYQLTNLDYSPNEPFQQRLESTASQYTPADADHPYKDSQPVKTAAPLATPRVQGGFYVGVDNAVDGGAEVSKVDLKLRTEQGRHLRLDPSTKSLEAIAFAAASQSPSTLAAEFRETETGTELVISLRNLTSIDALLANADTRKVLVFPDAANVAAGPGGGASGQSRVLESVSVTLSTGAPQSLWAWKDGSAGSVPAWWTAASSAAGTLKAWAVFSSTSVTNVGGEDRCTIAASSNISKIVRVAGASGRCTVYFQTAMANANYAVTGVANRNNDSVATLHHRHDDPSDTATDSFTIVTCHGGSNTNVSRASVAVFA